VSSSSTTTATREETRRRLLAASSGKPQRLALICDFLEENWPSMDLFGDVLAQCYEQEHAAAIAVEQLRPRLRARFSALPPSPWSDLFWNADRLINRFCDYPRWLRRQADRFDLFHLVDHSYGQLALVLPPERTVVTCHDLDTFRCLLEPMAEPRPRWFQAMAERTLRGFLRCSHVICPSEATRADVLRRGLFPSDRVTVIHPGADPAFFTAPDRSLAPLLGGSDQSYLLHVGTTIRRKRIDVLLRVFGNVVKEFPDVRLVRVGGALTASQSRQAEELGVGGNIVQAPHLTKAQLAAVYQDASILLQTSDAEGFGLPVIEAMACGCPVVASDIASLREAGGSAAEYCPVADIEAWSETVIRLLRERQAARERWEGLKMIARRHASAFTWPENARQTIAIYHRLSKGARRVGVHACETSH
jgi:glycosyltransferase involved in cell wall biosynthesis